MFEIQNEDENSVTVKGPNGPMTIAKSSVSPDFLGQLQAPTSPAAQGVNAGTPGLAGTILDDKAKQAARDAALKPPTGSDGAPLDPSVAPLATNPNGPLPPVPQAPGTVDGLVPSKDQSSPAAPAAPSIPKIPTMGENLDTIGKGIGMQEQAADKSAQAQAALGREQANVLSGMNDQLQKSQAQRAELEQQRQAERDAFKTQLNQANEKIAQSIPTKDFWADKGTGSRVVAAIAIGLGGVGAGLSGQPNQALNIIENAVKQDMERQKMRYEAARQGRSDLVDAYSLSMKQYGDRETAMNAALDLGFRKAQLEIDRYAKLAQAPEAMANAEKLKGQLEVMRGELGQKVVESQAKKMDEKRDFFVPAYGQFASSKEGAKDLNEKVAATNAAKGSINDLLKLSATPAASITPETRAKAEVTSTLLMAQLREGVLKGRSMTETDVHLLEKIVQNPVTIFSLDSVNKARLNQLMNRLDASLHSTAQAYGVMPPSSGPQLGTPRK